MNNETLRKFFRPEDKGKKKYSYIRNPHSINGIFSLVLGVPAFAATVALLIYSVVNQGQVPLPHASVGVSAIILSFLGITEAFVSIFEKEKNHVMAVIGGTLCLLTLAVWAALLSGL